MKKTSVANIIYKYKHGDTIRKKVCGVNECDNIPDEI